MNILGKRRGEKIPALLISVFFLLFYILFQSQSIFGGDAGDLVTAAFVRGIAHPPGYPLYTLVGWILTKIPILTVAWRVGLLSSIPSAISLGIIYLLTYRVSGSRIGSLMATFSMGFCYLFWLYAIIPEVFALHVLLALLFVYFGLKFRDTGKTNYLYIAVFVFGLEISHHHTIVLLLPGIIWMIFDRLKKLRNNYVILVKLGLCIIVGILPYIYVPLAAAGNPPINWEDPQTISGFIRLVTRAIYGTFQSNKSFGSFPLERYVQVEQMLETFVIDWSRLGVGLGFLGIVALWRRERKLWWSLFFLVFVSGPLFIYYSGFPALLNFHLGTSERFLLVPYALFSLWIGVGIASLSEWFDSKLRKLVANKRVVTVAWIFLILPLSLFFINMGRMLPLKTDQTAERLALDILNSLPEESILFPSDDTTFFNTSYVYYTEGGYSAWRNIKIIQLGALGYPFYNRLLGKLYPMLDIGEISPDDDARKVTQVLTNRYYNKYPIYSGAPFVVDDEYAWLPIGLFYRLYKKTDLKKMTPVEFVSMNEKVFSKFQDPLSGALGSYTHVLLADVLRIYANARREIGQKLIQLNELELAEKYFQEAFRLQPEVSENRNSLAGVQVLLNKCDAAKKTLTDIPEIAYLEANTYRILGIVAKGCDHDEAKYQEYEQKYLELTNQSDPKLEKF